MEAALTEIFLQVELLVFVLAHAQIAQRVLGFSVFLLTFSLVFFLLRGLWLSGRVNRIWMLGSKVNGFLDECLHIKDVKVVLLADALGLLFLACEWVTSEAYLD